ncbi:MAG TPA: phospholipase D-like domain-containing protein [Vicinamibacterales bacterium]|nr:phospholipase D-like domain-containing protein [Vicinamibacterales bacterium]
MAVTSDQARDSILVPGRTCWRLDRASRIRVIQDGAEYFRLVRQALLQAERTVFVLGWDIASRANLLPGESPDDGPTHLDDLIRFIARRRPRLRCYILTWDYSSLYSLERDPLSRYRLGWRTPRRVRFGYDGRHPWGACHHQKVVVVDDALAFSGSLDLTGHRWDTTAHRIEEPERVTVTGTPYGPYHEVQMMMDGDAAASLGELSRERWRLLGATKLPAVDPRGDSTWPEDVQPDFTDADVAISRTIPEASPAPAVRECEALTLESIAAARHRIYIENQYFTNAGIADAIAARLRESDGPEVVVVSPHECQGWLEQTTMGRFREAALRKLRSADRHKRLRIVSPTASRANNVQTFIHSKVMIVDDTLLRVGSANLSNRSMGMDTECDVSVGAAPDQDAEVRRGISAVLARLLAEHLGSDEDTIAAELKGQDRHRGSMCALIDARTGNDRTLIEIAEVEDAPEVSETLQTTTDPGEPIGFGPDVDPILPAVDLGADRSPMREWILPAAILAAALFVGWSSGQASAPAWLVAIRSFVRSVDHEWTTVVAAAGLFIAGAWCLVPKGLLTLAAATALGPTAGVTASFIGSIAVATTGYAFGRAVGLPMVTRWISARSYRLGRRLCRNGTGAPALLRFATAASATPLHLLCGAGKVRFGSYLLGSALGFVPPVVGLGILGGLLRRTLIEPTLPNALVAIGCAVTLVAAGFALQLFLLIRQFAPATAGQRQRAEFG